MFAIYVSMELFVSQKDILELIVSACNINVRILPYYNLGMHFNSFFLSVVLT